MKNEIEKTVTLQDFLMAEDLAVGSMARFMHDMNRSSDDNQTMTMMLDLILQVTTKMQCILFGTPEEEVIQLRTNEMDDFGTWDINGDDGEVR
ncbi:MAG: hypothetical protein J5379_04350 [Clostridiales bacterium]|nr:hypothetical protein [Clostridiales bacterium]